MDFKFKVGDKVRTLYNYDDNGNEVFEIGTEGIITSIIQEVKTDTPYKVEANNNFWYYSDDMLELVKDKTDKIDKSKVFKLVSDVIAETEGDNELLKDVVYYIECYRKREHLK